MAYLPEELGEELLKPRSEVVELTWLERALVWVGTRICFTLEFVLIEGRFCQQCLCSVSVFWGSGLLVLVALGFPPGFWPGVLSGPSWARFLYGGGSLPGCLPITWVPVWDQCLYVCVNGVPTKACWVVWA